MGLSYSCPMEGPSLYLAKEQLQPFVGKKVEKVYGNTKIEKERFSGETVRDIFSWGKHLIFQFDEIALKVHFLLFGTFSAEVEGVSVTGDYKKARTARLAFIFKNGQIEMYNCSVKIIDDPHFKDTYDFSVDVLSPTWDKKKALKSMRAEGESEIADVLLDQEIFSGVGNIIKNEVLSLAFVNPKQKVAELPPKKQRELVSLARDFSFQFYEWRKIFMLRKNLKIHRKGTCPHCGGKVVHEKTGKRQRISHYCSSCQKLL
jgi:endonuclease VIII